MKKSNNKDLLLFLLMVLVIFTGLAVQAEDFIGHREENVVEVYDEEGHYIFSTAMGVSAGDIYISEDNFEYIVTEVKDKKGTAHNQGVINLLEGVITEANVIPPLAADGKNLIGLFHTHNGESYLPGPDNVNKNGEIFDVGQVFRSALEKKGIRVVHSKNIHLPHDGAAYERSRATAVDIAKQRPDAIFDVHRDAVPSKKEYLKEVNGKLISQVRIVVGRQNPNRKVNEQFAKQLKAISDKKYPGLLRDIFMGKGAYNQEISPHSLLFEFGTHVTSKEQAEYSAAMLSDVIYTALYSGQGGEQPQQEQTAENKSSYSTIGWIVGIVALGIVVFLFINEGSLGGIIDRIRKFFGRELK